MKINKLLMVTVFMILFSLSACASTPIKTPEKYDLADQLKPVSEILKYNIMNWYAVDNQSLIVQTAPSQYYLIVLLRPSTQLLFSEYISISNTGSVVKQGFDKVTVYSSPYIDSFVIDKIFKLEGRDQAKAVTKQLTS